MDPLRSPPGRGEGLTLVFRAEVVVVGRSEFLEMGMSIETALRRLLIRDGEVYALVAERVYLLRLPQKPVYPAIVYWRVNTGQEMAHDGPVDLAMTRFQFDMYGETFAAVQAVAEAVRVGLNGYQGTVDEVQVWGVFFQNEMNDWGDLTGSWRITQDYMVMWRCEV